MSKDPSTKQSETKGFWKGDGRQGSAKESGGRRSGTPGIVSAGRAGTRTDLNRPLDSQQPSEKSSAPVKPKA